MSCGTKLDGRYGSYYEREDIARKLERDSEHYLADHVRRGDCLGVIDLHHAEAVLERQGMSRHFDYREEACKCPDDEEEY